VYATGAESLVYYDSNGSVDCNATSVVTYAKGTTEVIELLPNTTTKVNFVCAFANASLVSDNITFFAPSPAGGAWQQQVVG
jgi:hypothetical protein